MPLIPSGDYRIDALLGSSWWGKAFPGGVPSEFRLIVTFGFPATRPPEWVDIGGEYAGGNFVPLSEPMKAAARDAFAAYEKQIGLRFVEVSDGMNAQLRIGSTDIGAGSGRGQYPGDGRGGEVWIKSWATHSDFHLLLSHEIGHALGLKHPGAYDVNGRVPPGPYLPAAEDTIANTVMTYNARGENDVTGGRPYDVLALQYLYGAPDPAALHFLAPELAAPRSYAKPIALPQGTPFNDLIPGLGLLPGHVSQTAPLVWQYRPGDTFSFVDTFYVTIDGGAGYDIYFVPDDVALSRAQWEYENFTATLVRQGDAMLLRATWTNPVLDLTAYIELANTEEVRFLDRAFLLSDLPSGATTGDDTLIGTSSNDRIEGLSGNDSIDGGSGIDTAVFSHASNAYTISHSGTYAFTVNGPDGTDALARIERLEFSDKKVALDLDGLAGTTAKTLGAVFGKLAVANEEYVGIGLSLLDAGMDFTTLMNFAIDARLGPSASHADVVNLLYSNVTGSLPPESEFLFFQGLLDSGAHTIASLGVLAAETPLNASNIDLVGLVSSGLSFMPME